MGRSRFDNQGREGADVAAVPLFIHQHPAVLTMEPAVACADHPFTGCPDRPGVGCAVIVAKEALYRDLTGPGANLTGADAVRDRKGNALGQQRWAVRHQAAVKVLIGALRSALGKLSNG